MLSPSSGGTCRCLRPLPPVASGAALVVHEQNARPGLANRLISPRAASTLVAFPAAGERLKHSRVVGNPLRAELAAFHGARLRPQALSRYGLPEGRPVLGVIGGSLGAKVLNDVVARIAADADHEGLAIVHLTGALHVDELGLEAKRSPVPWVTVAFEPEMQYFYAAADVVLGRAGALTVSELAATGTPAVLVPLEASRWSRSFPSAAATLHCPPKSGRRRRKMLRPASACSATRSPATGGTENPRGRHASRATPAVTSSHGGRPGRYTGIAATSAVEWNSKSPSRTPDSPLDSSESNLGHRLSVVSGGNGLVHTCLQIRRARLAAVRMGTMISDRFGRDGPTPAIRLAAALPVVFCLLVATSGTVWAQDPSAVDTNAFVEDVAAQPAHDYTGYLRGGAWIAWIDGEIKDSSGRVANFDRIKIDDDLGFDDPTTQFIGVANLRLGRHDFWVSGFDYDERETETVEAQVEFGDITVNIGRDVRTRFEFSDVNFRYGYSFYTFEDDGFRLGPTVALSYSAVTIELTDIDTGLSEDIDETFPAPTLGLHGEIPVGNVLLEGDIAGVYIDADSFDGWALRTAATAVWRPYDNVGFFAGFNGIFADISLSREDVEAALFGPTVGIELRF